MFKKSLILFASLALACALACVDTLRDTVVAVHRCAVRAGDWLTARVVALSAMFRDAAAGARPAVAFVQARAFVARIVKRERPVLSASWRMCPSI